MHLHYQSVTWNLRQPLWNFSSEISGSLSEAKATSAHLGKKKVHIIRNYSTNECYEGIVQTFVANLCLVENSIKVPNKPLG